MILKVSFFNQFFVVVFPDPAPGPKFRRFRRQGEVLEQAGDGQGSESVRAADRRAARHLRRREGPGLQPRKDDPRGGRKVEKPGSSLF